jgi:hypothetical protein
MKTTTIEQVAEKILSAKQAQEKAEFEKRAAEEKMQRIREEAQAMGFGPEYLNEAVMKLEQEFEAELNKLAA